MTPDANGAGDTRSDPTRQLRKPTRGPEILCACGKYHKLTPTAMALVIQGFLNGDAQRVDVVEIYSMCIVEFLKHLPPGYLDGVREERISYE